MLTILISFLLFFPLASSSNHAALITHPPIAPIQSNDLSNAKQLKEIYWWKHAAACHKGSNIEGEGDWYIEDEVSVQVRAATGTASPAGASMSKARSIMDTPQTVPFGH